MQNGAVAVMTEMAGGGDAEARIRALVYDILTNHFMLEEAEVAACLDGTGPDIRISSRRALVVMARVQAMLQLGQLIDPKRLRPEEITSVRSVVALIVRTLNDRG